MDILINNASTKAKGTVQNVSLELDKKIMDANYFGPITLTKGIQKTVYFIVLSFRDSVSPRFTITIESQISNAK